MRTDKESTQVSNILCWKGWRVPRSIVRSQHNKHVQAGYERISLARSLSYPRMTLTNSMSHLWSKGSNRLSSAIWNICSFMFMRNNKNLQKITYKKMSWEIFLNKKVLTALAEKLSFLIIHPQFHEHTNSHSCLIAILWSPAQRPLKEFPATQLNRN